MSVKKVSPLSLMIEDKAVFPLILSRSSNGYQRAARFLLQYVRDDGEAVSEASFAGLMADTNPNCFWRIPSLDGKAASVADVNALAAALAREYIGTPTIGKLYPNVEPVGRVRQDFCAKRSMGNPLPFRGNAPLLCY